MGQDYNKATRVTDASALKETISRVEDGDTVKAVFFDDHYRTFEITGIVSTTKYDPNLLVLASWFLNTPAKAKGNSESIVSDNRGAVSKLLKELIILESTERTLF